MATVHSAATCLSPSPSDAVSTCVAAVQMTAEVPAQIEGILSNSSAAAARHRHREKNPNHVTWDEDAIREHDKERGTRQKIDEPDTPFVRSPQSASDCEGGLASSEDEGRLCTYAAVRLLGHGDADV